jgi:hypothetical protein
VRVLAATDVPLWAAILIGLGGGVLAALVRIVYDRGAEFRTRQLDATDDYLRIALEIQSAWRGLWLPLKDREERPSHDIDRQFDHLRTSRDERLLAFVRVRLLFGDGSRTARALDELDDALESASGALEVLYGRATLEAPMPGMTPALGLFESAAQRAATAYPHLLAAIRDDLRQTWLRRRIALLRPHPTPATARWPIRPKPTARE